MKSQTPSMFLETAYGFDTPPVRHDAPPTSVAAAESVKGLTATKQRREVLRLLADFPDGLLDEEIQHALYMNPSSERPRRGELVEAGLVRDSGLERKTNSGRSAIVWRITELGMDEVLK